MSILFNIPVKLLEICNVEVALRHDSNNEWYIDFATGMKSHLHLYYIDGKYVARCRYDHEEVIEYFEEFLWCLRKCMHGRDYMGYQWMDIYKNGFGEFTWDKINGGK